jgi:hypothetical protein
MISPGEQLIDKLETLRNRLNDSSVERTAGLAEALGRDCSFHKKSLKMFIDKDYEDLRAQINSIHSLFKDIG